MAGEVWLNLWDQDAEANFMKLSLPRGQQKNECSECGHPVLLRLHCQRESLCRRSTTSKSPCSSNHHHQRRPGVVAAVKTSKRCETGEVPKGQRGRSPARCYDQRRVR
ncbi:unnamed protein product [Larinioides sclopetarius]|uniref:Uncharacterized protein n=1 Tax=Larinioides sclopetarius TaxID=280406 RepID=A0AAV1ZJD0_9ARAC